MSKKLLTSVALSAVLLGLAACGDPEQDSAETQNASVEAEDSPTVPEDGGMPEMPEPDLDDIPEVVANVNGEDITDDEFVPFYESQFQRMAMQAQLTGEEIDQDLLREQTLDSLISNELLIQDAVASSHEASEDEIDALLEETAEDSGADSVEALIEAYEQQGSSEEQLREDAGNQILVDKLIADLDVAEPTEDELEELYEQFSAQQPPVESEDNEEAETPSFDELRPELEEEVQQQKQAEAVTEHAENLRQDADIETFL